VVAGLRIMDHDEPGFWKSNAESPLDRLAAPLGKPGGLDVPMSRLRPRPGPLCEALHEQGDGMTDSTSNNELRAERLSFIELAAASLVRSAEVAAVVLIAVLVCPVVLIPLVVVAVPLVALAALVTILAGVLAIPYRLAWHLRRRRIYHTSIVVHRLQRLQAAKGSR
jgi:hypothetical protein